MRDVFLDDGNEVPRNGRPRGAVVMHKFPPISDLTLERIIPFCAQEATRFAFEVA